MRDANKAFFRPCYDNWKSKRKGHDKQRKQKKRKQPTLTDKQRAAAAREHYARHYGPPSAPLSDHNGDTSPHPPDTPIAWTPPVILGHHQRQNVLDTTVVPIDFHDLLTYLPEADRKNLQNISNF